MARRPSTLADTKQETSWEQGTARLATPLFVHIEARALKIQTKLIFHIAPESCKQVLDSVDALVDGLAEKMGGSLTQIEKSDTTRELNIFRGQVVESLQEWKALVDDWKASAVSRIASLNKQLSEAHDQQKSLQRQLDDALRDQRLLEEARALRAKEGGEDELLPAPPSSARRASRSAVAAGEGKRRRASYSSGVLLDVTQDSFESPSSSSRPSKEPTHHPQPPSDVKTPRSLDHQDVSSPRTLGLEPAYRRRRPSQSSNTMNGDMAQLPEEENTADPTRRDEQQVPDVHPDRRTTPTFTLDILSWRRRPSHVANMITADIPALRVSGQRRHSFSSALLPSVCSFRSPSPRVSSTTGGTKAHDYAADFSQLVTAQLWRRTSPSQDVHDACGTTGIRCASGSRPGSDDEDSLRAKTCHALGNVEKMPPLVLAARDDVPRKDSRTTSWALEHLHDLDRTSPQGRCPPQSATPTTPGPRHNDMMSTLGDMPAEAPSRRSSHGSSSSSANVTHGLSDDEGEDRCSATARQPAQSLGDSSEVEQEDAETQAQPDMADAAEQATPDTAHFGVQCRLRQVELAQWVAAPEEEEDDIGMQVSQLVREISDEGPAALSSRDARSAHRLGDLLEAAKRARRRLDDEAGSAVGTGARPTAALRELTGSLDELEATLRSMGSWLQRVFGAVGLAEGGADGSTLSDQLLVRVNGMLGGCSPQRHPPDCHVPPRSGTGPMALASEGSSSAASWRTFGGAPQERHTDPLSPSSAWLSPRSLLRGDSAGLREAVHRSIVVEAPTVHSPVPGARHGKRRPYPHGVMASSGDSLPTGAVPHEAPRQGDVEDAQALAAALAGFRPG